MPAAPCSLLLEVYLPGGEVVDWSVSSDPDHVRPYLLGPERYEGQEIDPVSAAATIGTVEVGVIDPAQIPGEQTTGWMTERLGGLRGRRCRLRRWVDDVIGWVLIADGPAGVPRLDASYSAYRWPIRDTREIERKLKAFNSGGTAAIAPHGSVENWGALPEDSPEPFLLEGAVEHPMLGEYNVNEGSQYGFRIGYVDLETPEPISEEGEAAIQSQGDGTQSIHPFADVLWRIAGSDDPWNVARPVWPAPFSAGQLPLADVEGDEEEEGRQITRVYLWMLPTGADPDGSEAFDADPVAGVGEQLEVIIRHRGLASDAFPYYFDGAAGALLEDLYNGRLSGLDTKSVDAAARFELHDPAGQEDINALLAGGIRYDVEAVQQITTPVLLRQVEPADDGRNWAELFIYGPTGWIPALDGDGFISPVSRARPGTVTGPTINDAIAEPSPDWNAGERIVTSVSMTYKRYFKPVSDLTIAVELDGLAVREVGLTYIDPTAQANEGEQPESFDGSAFGAAGDAAGNAYPGVETGQLLFQDLRFEVLGRYAQGAQAIRVRVRREDVPFLRVGEWCPAALSWLPNTFTGLRGLELSAVQVLSIDDSECAWRNLLLEESPVAAPPGYFYDLEVLSDESEAGYFFDLEILSDEEEP